jgi:hypothetical protein
MGEKVDTRPMAMCPVDGEPLVMSMEVPKFEWLCMECGNRYAYFAPTPQPITPERQARHAELKARYDAGERPS